MKVLKLLTRCFFSYSLIIIVIILIGLSAHNSYVLIASGEVYLYSPKEHFPTIKIPDKLADALVQTVEAKLIN